MGAWEPDVRVVSDTAAPDRWVVYISIPLAELTPKGVQPGGNFFANFFRAHSGQKELPAWSANFTSGFHEPARPGKLTLE